MRNCENVPAEEGKRHAGLQRAVRRRQVGPAQGAGGHGQGDGAGEPKDHGDGVDGQDDELVAELLAEARHQYLVGNDEQGPDGAEEDEAEVRRDVAAVVVAKAVIIGLVGLRDDWSRRTSVKGYARRVVMGGGSANSRQRCRGR